VIDITNRGPVTLALARALGTSAPVIVADLSGTEFCDGAGLRALLNAHSRAAAEGRQLRAAVIAPQVRRMLTLPGAGPALDLYPDLAAIAGKQAPAGDRPAAARRGLRLIPGQSTACSPRRIR
jgi:anti-sigma B factor antagonist